MAIGELNKINPREKVNMYLDAIEEMFGEFEKFSKEEPVSEEIQLQRKGGMEKTNFGYGKVSGEYNNFKKDYDMYMRARADTQNAFKDIDAYIAHPGNDFRFFDKLCSMSEDAAKKMYKMLTLYVKLRSPSQSPYEPLKFFLENFEQHEVYKKHFADFEYATIQRFRRDVKAYAADVFPLSLDHKAVIRKIKFLP